jgi:hypothetical protein
MNGLGKVLEGMIAGFFILGAVAVGVALSVSEAMSSHRREMQATWVSESHDFGTSKSGRIWRQEEWTAAMKGTSELGKWKRVALVEDPDHPIYVLITDRLPDKARSDIDLSKSATLLLGGEDLILRGRFDVVIEDAP